jgi:pilus assembly protein CpaF
MTGRFLMGLDSLHSTDPQNRSTPHSGMTERINLHRFLLDKINLARLETIDLASLRQELTAPVRAYLRENRLVLNAEELTLLISDVADELIGFGPIEPLLKDDSISDILVLGHGTIYVERGGKLYLTGVHFADEAHLMRVVNKIVSRIGRRVDESAPLVDARLPDGSRVNVAIRPIAIDGPQVSIRKFARHPYRIETLVEFGSLSRAMADLLTHAIEGKVSAVISGGTGSGKTTLLNALSTAIPFEERLVTIEDAAELQLQQPHVVRMETRPASLEGRNEISQRDLVRNALRMRPDRIIVGEVRGAEAFDMLQAMNTGHDGSMTTVHANTPRDAIARIEQMVGMAGMPMTAQAIREQVASAIHLVVQTARLRDGVRRVTAISEITGMEDGAVLMRDIMVFKTEGVDLDGKIIGHFHATGVVPDFVSRIASIGVKLDPAIFRAGPA